MAAPHTIVLDPALRARVDRWRALGLGWQRVHAPSTSYYKLVRLCGTEVGACTRSVECALNMHAK